MKTVDEHLQDILGAVTPLPPLELSLLEAQGTVLAEQVTAPVALPPFDNSAMDGYAVVASDLASAPASLRVVADIAAGDSGIHAIKRGLCTRIMTGAPLPAGANAVVPVEWTDGGTVTVTVERSVAQGQYIRRRGEDVAEGQMVLEPGTRLGATQIGLLAAVGRDRVVVRPRPRVVILSTGAELVEPGRPVAPGQIWDANGYAITAAAIQEGCLGYRQGIVGDDPAEVLETIEDQLIRADAVVTTGGVSMGAYDVVKQVLKDIGTMRFEKVAMRPGKPQGFGLIEGQTPVFTLPGNPVSAYVSFQVFVRPALRAMRGLAPGTRPTVIARLTEPISSPPGLRHYARGVLEQRDGMYHVTPVEGQGSHQMASLAAANCLIVTSEDVTGLEAGFPVAVMRLP